VTAHVADLRALYLDLRAEHEALDGLLTRLQPEDWDRPTPAAGWQVRHQVAHLEFFDDLGAQCVAGDPSGLLGLRDRAAQSGATTEDEISLALLLPRADDKPSELLDGWRSGRAALMAAFEAAPPDRRVTWATGPLALASFATARLMETWAHGLDCYAAVGVAPVDTQRLRHVCHLGYRALPHAFRRARQEMPALLEELRLELIGPDGQAWQYGPLDASSVISGPAGEWARVAVQRMRPDHARRLRPEGALAEQALRVARAFA
jgi:uncharacterized protein (TIGR03084 family)